MLPILEPPGPRRQPYAADLGIAFQLTNFIRDIGEDLIRGRVYLPVEDLDRFGIDRADLARGSTVRSATDRLRDRAVPGDLPCRRTRDRDAPSDEPGLHPHRLHLYGGILDAIEKADYQVFDRRVTVPQHRRLSVAARPSSGHAGRGAW